MPSSPKRAYSLPGSYINSHFPDFINFGEEDIARPYGANALRGSRQDHIARMQRVERRGELDQFWNAKNKVIGVGVLPNFAVHGNGEGKSTTDPLAHRP